jgi:hypothetical protein
MLVIDIPGCCPYYEGRAVYFPRLRTTRCRFRKVWPVRSGNYGRQIAAVEVSGIDMLRADGGPIELDDPPALEDAVDDGAQRAAVAAD